jgi:hypothetical protein
MKLKLTLIACAAFLAFPLGAYAQSESSETNGVPGGTISTPGSEAKGNPIPPATKPGEERVIVTPEAPAPEAPLPPPPPPPGPQ